MKNTILINFVGESATGKTTIARELERFGYNIIQSYTTRPPRYENEWGHTFIELEPDDRFGKLGQWVVGKNKTVEGNLLAQKLVSQTGSRYEYYNMIAYFNSYNSGHHYFATDEQVIRNRVNIYIVDPKGADSVKRFYQPKIENVKIITINFSVSEQEKIKRLIQRYEKGVKEGWLKDCDDVFEDEVVDRIEKDKEIFKVVDCDYNINTTYITVDEIVDIVENIIQREGCV